MISRGSWYRASEHSIISPLWRIRTVNKICPRSEDWKEKKKKRETNQRTEEVCLTSPIRVLRVQSTRVSLWETVHERILPATRPPKNRSYLFSLVLFGFLFKGKDGRVRLTLTGLDMCYQWGPLYRMSSVIKQTLHRLKDNKTALLTRPADRAETWRIAVTLNYFDSAPQIILKYFFTTIGK